MFEELGINKGKSRFNIKDAIRKMTMLPDITLQAEEASYFIEGVWDQTAMKNYAELITMNSQKKNLRHLGLTERMLKPEGSFNTASIVTALTNNNVQLSTVELRAGLLIKDADLEDMNIGSASDFKAAVMRIVQNKLANEIEEWLWISDTHNLAGFGANDARSTIDGWRYQIEYSQTGDTYVNKVTGSANVLDASNTVTARSEEHTSELQSH